MQENRELTPEEQERLKEWEERAAKKSDNLPNGWGWKSTDRQEQQKIDEEEHPSK